MNGYLLFIVALLIFQYVFSLVVEWLDSRNMRTEIPDEFKGLYDEEKYAKSQRYNRDNTRFDLVTSTLMLPVTLGFILLGGFRLVDGWARAAGGDGLILTGLLFAGILILLSQLVHLPFSIYSTFVLEEKYGFNRTTPKTFILDLIKGLLLTALLGGAIFSAILWFFSRVPENAWWYSWVAVTVFQFILIYLAPAYIMPLFNKFTPLEDGELKAAIQDYADRQGFSLQGIFKMDGSRRSAKSNAYFTGFGKWKRIVLFDTLIEKHEVDELVGVLAHEVGHFKLKHIGKMMGL